jgi:hypothetical protein
MSPNNQENWQIVSVRLPRELSQRLDRYLDWSGVHQGVKSSRNAAMRQALSTWLDHQEQLAGFLDPHRQRQQFQSVYQHLSKDNDWVAIYRLRDLLPWARQHFDSVVEGLRADHQIELHSPASHDLSPQALQDSYHVHGHLYIQLRWRN